LGYDTIEKCFENPDFILCSTFQNLRLGSINLFVEYWNRFVYPDIKLIPVQKGGRDHIVHHKRSDGFDMPTKSELLKIKKVELVQIAERFQIKHGNATKSVICDAIIRHLSNMKAR